MEESDRSFVSETLREVDQIFVDISAGLSIFFAGMAISLYFFLYWWDKKFVSQSITRLIVASLVPSFTYACIYLLSYTIHQTDNSCKYLGWILRSCTLMYNWLCFFTMFQMQIIAIHKVKNYVSLEKWYYIISFVISFIPTIFPLIYYWDGFRMRSDGYCGYVRVGSRRAFLLRWVCQFVWIVVALILSFTSMSLVYRRVKKTLKSTRRKKAIIRHLRPSRHTNDDRGGLNLEGQEIINASKNKHAKKTLELFLKRLLWIPLVPIVTQLLYILSVVIDYAAGRIISVTYVIGHSLFLLQAFFMSLALLTDPRVIISLRIIKGNFIDKWYDEQQEYWLAFLLRGNIQELPRFTKRHAIKIGQDSLLNYQFMIHKYRTGNDNCTIVRQKEFEGYRAQVAYWICKNWLN